MRIREATLEDKVVWDSFIDAQNGSFHYYFDWKFVNETLGEQFIPLMIEADSQLIGIFPLVKREETFYSTLGVNGPNGILFRKDISNEERHRATSILLKYIEENFSRRCSTFRMDEIQQDLTKDEKPDLDLIDHGFRLRRGAQPDLPCVHVLPLKAPFEEHIWKGLWSKKFRQALNKVAKNGVTVIQDPEFRYLGDYLDLLAANYRRHRETLRSKEGIITEFNIFRDKTKLFVALSNDQPVVILSCHYTPSTCYLWEIGSSTKDTDDANKFCCKVAIEDACNAGYQLVYFGGSNTEGLAKLKERFGAIRLRVGVYEKRYSISRVLMELTPTLIKLFWYRRTHLWKNPRILWDRIVRW